MSPSYVLVLMAIPRRKVTKRRLGIETKPRSVSDMGKRTAVAVDDLLERYGKRGALATDLTLAGIRQAAGEFRCCSPSSPSAWASLGWLSVVPCWLWCSS